MKASLSALEEGGLSSGWVNISGTASSKVAKNPNSVRQKPPLIARQAAHHCAPLVRRETGKE